MKCVKTCRLRPGPRAASAPAPAVPLRELTPSARECLDAILHHLAVDGVPPTLQDLADWLGARSKAAVWHLVGTLRRAGWLTPRRSCYRDLRLTPAALVRLRSVAAGGGRVVVSLWEPAAALTPAEARRLAADLLAAADAAEGGAP